MQLTPSRNKGERCSIPKPPAGVRHQTDSGYHQLQICVGGLRGESRRENSPETKFFPVRKVSPHEKISMNNCDTISKINYTVTYRSTDFYFQDTKIYKSKCSGHPFFQMEK